MLIPFSILKLSCDIFRCYISPSVVLNHFKKKNSYKVNGKGYYHDEYRYYVSLCSENWRVRQILRQSGATDCRPPLAFTWEAVVTLVSSRDDSQLAMFPWRH